VCACCHRRGSGVNRGRCRTGSLNTKSSPVVASLDTFTLTARRVRDVRHSRSADASVSIGVTTRSLRLDAKFAPITSPLCARCILITTRHVDNIGVIISPCTTISIQVARRCRHCSARRIGWLGRCRCLFSILLYGGVRSGGPKNRSGCRCIRGCTNKYRCR
jgi:hypothetical protein